MIPRVLLLALVVAVAVAGWFASYGLWKYRDAVREIGRLEPRDFDQLTLVVAGSGGEYENPSRLGPVLAVGSGSRVVLVDAGRGVAEALRHSGIGVDQPSSVYLTSLLPENTVGLDDLLITGWRSGRSQPLRVLGPPGTQALAAAIQAGQERSIAALAAAIGLPEAGARLEATELASDWSGSEGELGVRAVALPGGPLPALAFRFEAGGHAVAVGSVGWGADRLEGLARGVDTLVHGAVFQASVEAATQTGTEEAERIRREAALQLSLREVAELAQRARATRLVLVRLRPPPLFDFQFRRLAAEAFSGRVQVAADGDEITPGSPGPRAGPADPGARSPGAPDGRGSHAPR